MTVSIRRTFYAIATWVIVLFAGAGCVTTASSGAYWADNGYRQAVFGYQVAYRDPGAKKLVGSGWQIDNFRYDPGFNSYTEKVGDEYVAIRAEDVNADGTVSDSERKIETIFDLRFVSKANNGVMWVKAHPFLPEDAERSLEVILETYADSLSGSGRYAQGNLFGIEKASERNFTTFLASKSVIQVGGQPALAGSIELAEVDKLKTDPGHRDAKVRIVLVKMRCYPPSTCRKLDAPIAPPRPASALAQPQVTAGNNAGDMFHMGKPADVDASDRWPLVDCKGTKCRARVGLLIVGYYNTPAYFDEGMPEFEDLLKRISFTDAEPLPVPPPKPIPQSTDAPNKEAPR
jgi:hypothetical protein